MSLRALADALNTLDILFKQQREMRGRDDLPAGHFEQLDHQIGETMKMAMASLKEVVADQSSGDLDEAIRKEDAEIGKDDV